MYPLALELEFAGDGAWGGLLLCIVDVSKEL